MSKLNVDWHHTKLLTFLWTVIYKTRPSLIRISNISVTCPYVQLILPHSHEVFGLFWEFFGSGSSVEIALSHRHGEKQWFSQVKQIRQFRASERTTRLRSTNPTIVYQDHCSQLSTFYTCLMKLERFWNVSSPFTRGHFAIVFESDVSHYSHFAS